MMSMAMSLVASTRGIALIPALAKNFLPWSVTSRPLAGEPPTIDAEWLDGGFSAGDLMMVSVLLRLKLSGLLNEFPNLAAYVARGEARAAYKRAFDAQLAVFTGNPPPGR